MKIKTAYKIISVLVLLGLSGLCLASPILTIKNNTKYIAEVSGLVGATSSHVIIKPGDKTKISAKSNWVGHIMLFAPGQDHYQNNIVLKDSHNKLKYFSLYDKINIKYKTQELTLGE